MLELENFVLTPNKFHYYLNPERKVCEQAFKVHGYTDIFLSKQKNFPKSYSFFRICKDKNLIIHNASFDLSHLNNELAILGKRE